MVVTVQCSGSGSNSAVEAVMLALAVHPSIAVLAALMATVVVTVQVSDSGSDSVV